MEQKEQKVGSKRAVYPKQGGRPLLFSKEIADKIITAVQAGNYMETAAAFAGVPKQTFYEWLKRGGKACQVRAKGKEVPEKELQFMEFSDAIEKAIAEAEVLDLSLIKQAARDGNWQAAAWRLERHYPDRWGRKDRHDVNLGSLSDTPVNLTIKYE
jgi:hypothetical protein